MAGGPSLLELLGSGDFGRWLFIHGHRHRGSLGYGAGTSKAPVIFGAASFSAYPYTGQLGISRNQFYMLKLPYRDYPELKLELAGTLQAWDWADGVGWQPASTGSGIPAVAGFGHREELEYLAKRIVAHLRTVLKKNKAFVSWDELLPKFTKLPFLVPLDVTQLCKALEQYGATVLRNEQGQVSQLGVK
jgi:hypothetical protein